MSQSRRCTIGRASFEGQKRIARIQAHVFFKLHLGETSALRCHLGSFGTDEPASPPVRQPNTVRPVEKRAKSTTRRLSTLQIHLPRDDEVRNRVTEYIVLLRLSTAVRCTPTTFQQMKLPIATISRDVPDIAGLGEGRDASCAAEPADALNCARKEQIAAMMLSVSDSGYPLPCPSIQSPVLIGTASVLRRSTSSPLLVRANRFYFTSLPGRRFWSFAECHNVINAVKVCRRILIAAAYEKKMFTERRPALRPVPCRARRFGCGEAPGLRWVASGFQS